MKKYKGNRKFDDVCKIMNERGMSVDSRDFDRGGDFVNFSGLWFNVPVTIMFNSFNGQFMVFNKKTDERLATHLSVELDGEQWYNDLMDTLYEPLECQLSQ